MYILKIASHIIGEQSVCLSSKFDFNSAATSLQNTFGDDLSTNTTRVFRSEMKRWVKFCKRKQRIARQFHRHVKKCRS